MALGSAAQSSGVWLASVRNIFGAALKRLLERHRLSQTEFAERAGVAQSDVSRWIKGTRFPEARHFDRISAVLGVPFTELFRSDQGGELITVGPPEHVLEYFRLVLEARGYEVRKKPEGDA